MFRGCQGCPTEEERLSLSHSHPSQAESSRGHRSRTVPRIDFGSGFSLGFDGLAIFGGFRTGSHSHILHDNDTDHPVQVCKIENIEFVPAGQAFGQRGDDPKPEPVRTTLDSCILLEERVSLESGTLENRMSDFGTVG